VRYRGERPTARLGELFIISVGRRNNSAGDDDDVDDDDGDDKRAPFQTSELLDAPPSPTGDLLNANYGV